MGWANLKVVRANIMRDADGWSSEMMKKWVVMEVLQWLMEGMTMSLSLRFDVADD